MAMISSEQAVNVTKYMLCQLPTSPAGLRLTDGLVKSAALYNIHDIKGFDLKLIGSTVKDWDSILYIPKFVRSVENFVLSIRKYDSARRTNSIVKIIFSAVRVAGDGSASMKFLVGLGLSFYMSKRSLGYLKNTCSILSAGYHLYNGVVKSPNGQSEIEQQAEFRSQHVWELLAICSSTLLNGLGGLTTWVGPERFNSAGKKPMPDWTWPALIITGSVASVVKDYKG